MSVSRICSVDWCDKQKIARGLCSAHYARLQRGQDLDEPFRNQGTPEFCKLEDCGRRYSANGYCSSHDRMWKSGKPLDTPIRPRDNSLAGTECTVQGCGELNSGQGMCRFHRTRHLAGRDLNAPRRTVALSSLCAITGCDRDNQSKGLCKLHAAQVRKYNVTLEWIDKRFASGCEICGALGVLQVDHDHSCCPDNHSCGGCARGLLCSGCNRGLGCFEDNWVRVQEAAQYLQGNTV